MSLVDIAARIAIGIGGIYLLICTLLWVFQEKLIFHPQPLAKTPDQASAAALEIQGDEAVLRGWTVNADHEGPLIVYFGGNAEEVSIHIDEFAQRQATTVLVNYRGFGLSEGKPSEQALVADAQTVIEWAKQRFPSRPLVLFGLSLGSGVAALASPAAKPDALILVSPYRSVEHIARSTYPFVPIRWLLRHPFRAASAVDAMPRSLVFAAPNDRVIRFAESQAMVELLGDKATLRTFDVAHGDFLFHAPVWEAIDEFLKTIPVSTHG